MFLTGLVRFSNILTVFSSCSHQSTVLKLYLNTSLFRFDMFISALRRLIKSLALKVLKMRVNYLGQHEAFATTDDRDDVDVVLALVPFVFARLASLKMFSLALKAVNQHPRWSDITNTRAHRFI